METPTYKELTLLNGHIVHGSWKLDSIASSGSRFGTGTPVFRDENDNRLVPLRNVLLADPA